MMTNSWLSLIKWLHISNRFDMVNHLEKFGWWRDWFLMMERFQARVLVRGVRAKPPIFTNRIRSQKNSLLSRTWGFFWVGGGRLPKASFALTHLTSFRAEPTLLSTIWTCPGHRHEWAEGSVQKWGESLREMRRRWTWEKKKRILRNKKYFSPHTTIGAPFGICTYCGIMFVDNMDMSGTQTWVGGRARPEMRWVSKRNETEVDMREEEKDIEE